MSEPVARGEQTPLPSEPPRLDVGALVEVCTWLYARGDDAGILQPNESSIDRFDTIIWEASTRYPQQAVELYETLVEHPDYGVHGLCKVDREEGSD
jgi:hypothetical protein